MKQKVKRPREAERKEQGSRLKNTKRTEMGRRICQHSYLYHDHRGPTSTGGLSDISTKTSYGSTRADEEKRLDHVARANSEGRQQSYRSQQAHHPKAQKWDMSVAGTSFRSVAVNPSS